MRQVFVAAVFTVAGTLTVLADCSDARFVWADVKGSQSPEVIEEYLQIFGDCAIYSGLAQERLAALGGAPLALVETVEAPDDLAKAADDVAPAIAEAEVEHACLSAAMAPLHVDGYAGVMWRDLSVDAALAACEPLMGASTPDGDALAAYGRALLKAEDFEMALSVSFDAFRFGSALGANTLGVMYRDGDGVEKDLESALEFFRVAAQRGSPMGHMNFGDFYRDGTGVAVDGRRALDAYEAASELGYGPAYDRIGWLYRKGEVIPQDTTKAVYAFVEAYHLGEYASGASVGHIFETGLGGHPQNDMAAFDWYQAVASKGVVITWAVHRAGTMLMEGRGVQADEKAARDLYLQAAEAGYAPSQRELGRIYWGQGQVEEAEYWLRRAAKQNDKDAQGLLAIWF